jgi:hypothetical protein
MQTINENNDMMLPLVKIETLQAGQGLMTTPPCLVSRPLLDVYESSIIPPHFLIQQENTYLPSIDDVVKVKIDSPVKIKSKKTEKNKQRSAAVGRRPRKQKQQNQQSSSSSTTQVEKRQYVKRRKMLHATSDGDSDSNVDTLIQTDIHSEKKPIVFPSTQDLKQWLHDVKHTLTDPKMIAALDHVCGFFYSIGPLPDNALGRLKAVTDFYTEDRLRNVIVPIITSSAPLSLRTLDYFVINYSRRFDVSIQQQTNGHIFNVYKQYRTLRKLWSKDLFDVCRRSTRIYLKCGDKYYRTTVAQLNYLYWCETKGILAHASRMLNEINKDMTEHSSQSKVERTKLPRDKKKMDLCRAAPIKSEFFKTCVLLKINS